MRPVSAKSEEVRASAQASATSSGAELIAAAPKKKTKGGSSQKGDADKKPAEKPWPTDSINLDSMKYTRDFSSGFLLAGAGGVDWSSLISSSALDPKNIPSIMQMLGKGIAIVFGVAALIAYWILSGIARLFIKAQTTGARPEEKPSGAMSGAIAFLIFLVGAIIGLVVPIGEGGGLSAQGGDAKKSLTMVPVHSNEFHFHVFMAEPIKKEKYSEKLAQKDLPYTVVGYRDEAQSKNEMAIGYAHLPSLDEMIKEKELMSQPLLPGAPAPISKQQYYFDSQKALDGAVSNIENKGHIKVTFKCVCLLPKGKLPGRELEGTTPDGRLVRTRIYIGYNNAYQIIVAGEPSFVNSNEAFKFLDSLAVGEGI